MNESAIARTLGTHRHTVQKYAALESAPERKPRVRKVSALAPYEDHILRRFMDGCRNATLIHKEIPEQGYPGSCKNVWRVIQYLKRCEHEGKPLPEAPPGPLPTQAKGILIMRPEKRMEIETLTMERMKRADPDIQKCCRLLEITPPTIPLTALPTRLSARKPRRHYNSGWRGRRNPVCRS